MKVDDDRNDMMAAWLVWSVPSFTWIGAMIWGIFFGVGKGSNPPAWFSTTVGLSIPASVFLALYFGLRLPTVRSKRLSRIISRGCFFGVSTVAAPILSAMLSSVVQ